VQGVDGDNHRSGLLGAPRISAWVTLRGRENRGRFVVQDWLTKIWEEFLFVLGEETKRESVYHQLYRGGGKHERGPGVLAHGEGLV